MSTWQRSTDDRQSVLGFTEAELGFFLAVLCLLLWVATTASSPPNSPQPIGADSARRLVSEIDRWRDSARRVDSTYKRLRDSLKSTIPPNCTEIGKATGPIGILEVPNADSVKFRGASIVLSDLAVLTQRLRDSSAHCWHQVDVRFQRGLSGERTEAVRRQLLLLRLRLKSVEWFD